MRGRFLTDCGGGLCTTVGGMCDACAEASGVKHVIPADLAEAPLWDRIAWLREDAKDDDLMAGVPRYQPRYTEREQQIVALLAAGIDDGRGGAA